MVRRLGLLHIGLLGVIGVGGWAAVVVVTLWPPGMLRSWQLSWELLAVLVLCSATRFLAFNLFQRLRVALDSVFYVASAFAFGVVPAAWIALLVMTLHGLVPQINGGTSGERSLSYRAAMVLYGGSSPALVCLAVGLLLDVDGHALSDDLTLAWLVPLFAVCGLVLHYLLAGGSHWFDGVPPKGLWQRLVSHVIPSELLLTPIALTMVYGYRHQGPTPFFLLGASVVLFNVVFRSGRVVRDTLDARIEELKTLARVGKIISGSLERRLLLSNIATETLRLVGCKSWFTFGQLDGDRKRVNYELFNEKGEHHHERSAPAGAGLSGWVMSHRQQLLLGNVPAEAGHYLLEHDGNPLHRYIDSDLHRGTRSTSWLGVPLVVHDEVVGIISVQTDQPEAYNEDTGRILSRIAEQAAVALENSRLYELATVDGLTHLLVRRHFDLRLEEEWERALRYGNHFAVGILDLDNFKEVNDTFGHPAGDWMLRAAATTVGRNMRAADLAGRYGGEEFAFLLPRATLAEACTVAERIRSDIENLAVEHSGAVLRVRASIGVAAHPESGVRDVDELIARADEALYQAKGAGKNRVVAAPTTAIGPTHEHKRRP